MFARRLFCCVDNNTRYGLSRVPRKIYKRPMTKPIPKIMGILNATPDSFFEGSRQQVVGAALDHAAQMISEGADIIDIGGESTRPGAALVPADQELSRVLPIIEALRARFDVPLSIDTRKASVAKAAIDVGAQIWNDVSALSFDEASIEIAATLGCEIVLMHAQGDPKNMQDAPAYDHVVSDILAYLVGRAELCVAAGVTREKIIIDPGIGFGKTLAHNLALLANLEAFGAADLRVLLGASRKSFIANIDDGAGAEARLGGSIATAIAGQHAGIEIVRVHDVGATRQALLVAASIQGAKSSI